MVSVIKPKWKSTDSSVVTELITLKVVDSSCQLWSTNFVVINTLLMKINKVLRACRLYFSTPNRTLDFKKLI